MAKLTFLVPLFLISTQLILVQCIVVSQYLPTIKKCCPEDQQLVLPNNTQCQSRRLPSGLWPLEALDLYFPSMLDLAKKDWQLEIGFPDCTTEDLRHTNYVTDNVDRHITLSSDGQLYLKEYQLLLPASSYCVDEIEQGGSLHTVIHYCFENLANIHKCCPEGSALIFMDKGIQCVNFSVTLHPSEIRWQMTYGFPDCDMYALNPENEDFFYFLPSGQLWLPSKDKNPSVVIEEYCIDYVLEYGTPSKEINALICFGAAHAIYPCFWLTVVTAIFGEFAFHNFL